MQDIVNDIFNKWTNGLTPEESRIRIFEKIRDIPYFIAPELFDFEKGPGKMLLLNKGFCVPKHLLLGIMYEKMGISVEYCIYGFRWGDVDLAYPEKLREKVFKLPITNHLACRAPMGGKHLFLDATWDSALKKASFPVNDMWDGLSDTRIAVKPLNEVIAANIDEAKKILKKRISEYNRFEKLELFMFSNAFNKWLMEVREK